MKKRLALLLALLLSLALPLPAAALVDKSGSYYVCDDAGVLGGQLEDYIVEANGALEHYCQGAQIVVVSVAYTDALGNLRTAEAAPVSIQIDKSGAEPESVSSLYGLDSEAPVQEISGDGAYLWMIALGGGVLVVLIIILVVSHDRDRRNWKMQKIRRKKNSAKRGATPAAKRGGNDV